LNQTIYLKIKDDKCSVDWLQLIPNESGVIKKLILQHLKEAGTPYKPVGLS